MSRDAYAEHFDGFADWCVGTSPLYERLARGVADNSRGSDLLALAEETPEGRSPAHLLLASVHFLLLGGRDHPLADYYPTVVENSIDPAEDDPFPAFREFCLSNADEIRRLVTTRRTQTNSVRRCVALFPAFEEVSRRASRGGATHAPETRASESPRRGRGDRRPLAIVEIGPSAGLNLLWDRYGYDYGDVGRYGDLDSPVCIESEVRTGDPPLPDEVPPVASRVGVDVNPLDVTDTDERSSSSDRTGSDNPDDARWLQALVWPEHDDRHRLLEAAVEVARHNPPDLREGDALELLPDVVAEIPDDRPVCLFDMQVRYQMDEAARERFSSLVADLSANRELYVVSGDRSADEYERGIELTLRSPDGETERLGVYEQHGKWIAWDE